MSIDTGKVKDRRTLRFGTVAEVRRDLDAMETAHKRGTLRCAGNWTPGQIFTHLSAFINFGYDGYPKEVSPPWLLAVIFIRPRRAKYLNKGFPAGVKIPGTKQGTIGMEDVTFEEGIARFRVAHGRLEESPPTVESPAFGPMTYDEKIRMALGHAEHGRDAHATEPYYLICPRPRRRRPTTTHTCAGRCASRQCATLLPKQTASPGWSVPGG